MNIDNVEMEPREPLPFTKRLMEKVKDLRPESQIRLDYYLTHLHHSLDHEVQLHIWQSGATGMQPAVLSLRTRGRIQSSSTVSLSDLAAEILDDATEEEVVQPLIVLTSSESEDAERRRDDRDASPRLQHLPEQLLTPKPNATSKRAPRLEKGHVKLRRRHTFKARSKSRHGLTSKGLTRKGDEDARSHETSSEGEWESHDSLNVRHEGTRSGSESMLETTLPESEANSSGSLLLQISSDLLIPKDADIDKVRSSVPHMDKSCPPSAERATTPDADAFANQEAEVPCRGPEPNDALEGMVGTPVGISKSRWTEYGAKLSKEELIPALPAGTPQVTTGTLPKRIPKKKIMDPGLNPLSATRIGEQAREAAMVNRRVALNTSETWAPGALEKVTHLIGEFQARLEEQEREKLWQTMELSQTFLIPKTIRIYDAEMTVHARRAENMRYLWNTKNTSASTAVPYPAQGDQWERWCLFCYRLLRSADASPHPVSCTCANTLRYGTMEVESDEDTATLLAEKFWGCQTFAEAQEFFLMRLHARAFAQDLEPPATLVTGLSVDQWPVHMRLPHKEKMQRLGFPADLLRGEEPIVEFPARIALATAAKIARVQDLKAPVQTDPVRLTKWAHARASTDGH